MRNAIKMNFCGKIKTRNYWKDKKEKIGRMYIEQFGDWRAADWNDKKNALITEAFEVSGLPIGMIRLLILVSAILNMSWSVISFHCIQ